MCKLSSSLCCYDWLSMSGFFRFGNQFFKIFDFGSFDVCVCVRAVLSTRAFCCKCVLMRLHTISTMTACSFAETYRAGGVTFVPFLCALTNSLRAKALGCRTIVAQQKKKKYRKGDLYADVCISVEVPFFYLPASTKNTLGRQTKSHALCVYHLLVYRKSLFLTSLDEKDLGAAPTSESLR